jgi:hypothetical protein
MNSLIHDVAFRISLEILRAFSGVLMEMEHKEAFCEIYNCIRDGLLEYETKADRRMSRLNPGRN